MFDVRFVFGSCSEISMLDVRFGSPPYKGANIEHHPEQSVRTIRSDPTTIELPNESLVREPGAAID
jgi:hypothetical protein